MNNKYRPLLVGFTRMAGKQTLLDVWCPNCGLYHTHGWDYSGKIPVSRRAHCNDQTGEGASFYKEKTYWILPVVLLPGRILDGVKWH